VDRIDWYYLQRVLESELDLGFSNAEAAVNYGRSDIATMGAHSGLTVTQNAAPDLNVLIAAGIATDPDGYRMQIPSTQTVDCSQDYLGNATTVAGAGNERWLSVILKFDTSLSSPVVDGNGVTVYTRIADSYTIEVHMAGEFVAGTNTKPAIPVDGVLLADIVLVFGTVQILNADISLTRRQDYVRATGATLADFVAGDPQDGIDQLYTICDGLAAATGIAYAAGQNWHDGTSIAGVTVSAALDEIISDLAADAGAGGSDKIGSVAYATAGGNADLTQGSVQDQLQETANYIDGHIGGGAPQHDATVVTYTPHGFIAATDVGSALDEIADDLAASAPGPSGATLIGYETPEGGSLTVEQALDARPRHALDDTITGQWAFQDVVNTPIVYGGWFPPRYSYPTDLPKSAWWNYSWGHPWNSENVLDLGVASEFVDLCMFYSSEDTLTGAGSETVRPYIGALRGTAASPELRVLDPHDMTLVATVPLSGWGTHNPANAQCQACATTANRLYLLITDGVHAGGDYIAEYNLSTMAAGWHTDLGAGVLGGYPKDRLRVVNDGNDIVALYGGVTSGGAGVAECFNNAGVSQWRADGDAPANAVPAGGLCSDETDVFFTCRVGAAAPYTYQLCSATIAAGADPGYANLPGTCCTTTGGGAKGECHDCVFDGRKVWFVTGHDGAAGNAHIGWFDPTTDVFLQIAWNLADGVTARDSFACCFDGVNLWLHDFVQAGAGAASFARVIGFPVANLQSLPTANAEPPGNHYFLKDRAAAASVGILNKLYAGRMCFDGDSIFVIVDDSTNKRLVCRVPRSGLRG